MYLDDWLDAPVRDEGGARLGYVLDVRLVLDAPPPAPSSPLAAPRVHGFVVCPRHAGSFFGYERSGVTAPAVVARSLRWWYRGTFLILWNDVVSLPGAERAACAGEENVVVVRTGCTRYDAALPSRSSAQMRAER